MGSCSSTGPQAYKVSLVGEPSTGKTAYFNRITRQAFLHTTPTRTFNYAELTLPHLNDQGQFLLHLLDISGQSGLQDLVCPFLKESHAVIIFFSSEYSFSRVSHWLNLVRTHTPEGTAIMLIGNKTDEPYLNLANLTEKSRLFSRQNYLLHQHTSCRRNKNTLLSMQQLIGHCEETSLKKRVAWEEYQQEVILAQGLYN